MFPTLPLSFTASCWSCWSCCSNWLPGARLPHHAPGGLWSARRLRLCVVVSRRSLRSLLNHRNRLALRLSVQAEHRDLGLEVLDGVEGAVDRCKAEVGDLVELAQRSEDGQA